MASCVHDHTVARLELPRSAGQWAALAAGAPETAYGDMTRETTRNRVTSQRVNRESKQMQLAAGSSLLSAHLCRCTMHPKEMLERVQ